MLANLFPIKYSMISLIKHMPIVKAQVGATLLPIKYMTCRNLPIGVLVMGINILTGL